MNRSLKAFITFAGVALASQAMAHVTFYENENFHGQSFRAQRLVTDFSNFGFNDRASSADVVGESWEVCDDKMFGGRCVVLRPGRYPSLAAMGLNDRVSSSRVARSDLRADDRRFAPTPVDAPDFRRRDQERLYEANVSSVRAVVGAPEKRCWVEREQVKSEPRSSNVPGAVVGALIGGVLGHQVGGGAGKDLATVGGAVAGAAIGAQTGRNDARQTTQTHDVKRCRDVPSQVAPEFWDVSYTFRGQAHRVQLSAPPGRTITVNARGEPRE